MLIIEEPLCVGGEEVSMWTLYYLLNFSGKKNISLF